MTARVDISPEHLTIVQRILRENLPENVQTWAFGSRVQWQAREFSDLDLALEGNGPLPAVTLLDLETAFEESDLPWRVDLVDLHRVEPAFRAIIEAQRVPVRRAAGRAGRPVQGCRAADRRYSRAAGGGYPRAAGGGGG